MFTRTQLAIIAALVGVLYAVGWVVRDQAFPGIVGGILAGILMYLVLLRVNDRARRRRRQSGGE